MPRKHKILIYAGPGAGKDSICQIELTLKTLLDKKYKIDTIAPRMLMENEWEDQTAMLIMPGGADIPYTHLLNGKGNQKISQYVHEGGLFMGICAGSYYGGRSIEFAVGSPIEIIGNRELSFFPGTVQGPILAAYDYKSHAGARALRLHLGQTYSPLIFYNGGGCFINAAQFDSVEVIANYDNHAKNAAIIKCKVGKGIALLSGVHFEFAPQLMDSKDIYLQKIILELEKEDGARIQFVKSLLNSLSLKTL